MNLQIFQIAILAMIQGLAELLPVSSSAHVIVAERLMGIDPSAPEMTFLLVMLHTGTMFAVLFYYRNRWLTSWREKSAAGRLSFKSIALATATTGVFGLGLKKVIEKCFMGDIPHAEIEMLFGDLRIVGVALAAVGVLILYSGRKAEKNNALNTTNSVLIGAIQGLCLPFRGFSRSGATISMGLITGVSRGLAEEFSFALAVVLTPPVVIRELLRLLKSHALQGVGLFELLGPGLVGMALSFGAGFLALRWVSSWIEGGRWKWFGYYCLVASVVVFGVHWHLT